MAIIFNSCSLSSYLPADLLPITYIKQTRNSAYLVGDSVMNYSFLKDCKSFKNESTAGMVAVFVRTQYVHNNYLN